MLRQFSICALAMTSAMLVLAGVARAEDFTTRIETRPYYGAVTTIEHGVRVIRPLPPVRQVIINPNGTPLSLGYNDTRIYQYGSNGGYGDVRISRGAYSGDFNEDGPIYSYPAYPRRFWGRHGRFGRFGHFNRFNNRFNRHFKNFSSKNFHGRGGHRGIKGVPVPLR